VVIARPSFLFSCFTTIYDFLDQKWFKARNFFHFLSIILKKSYFCIDFGFGKLGVEKAKKKIRKVL